LVALVMVVLRLSPGPHFKPTGAFPVWIQEVI